MEMKGRMWEVLGVGVALCLRSARRERRVQFGRVLEAATSGKKKKEGGAPGALGQRKEEAPQNKVENCEPRIRNYFGPWPLTLGRGVPGRHDTAGGLY